MERKRKPEFRFECDIALRKRFSETLHRLGLKRAVIMQQFMQKFIDMYDKEKHD